MLLNSPFVTNRIETIDFKAFLSRESPKNSVTVKKRAFLFSSVPFNPTAMVDPVFIGIAAAVLLVALAEKWIANSGNVLIASLVSTFLKILFPAVGIAALWFLLNNLKFLF